MSPQKKPRAATRPSNVRGTLSLSYPMADNRRWLLVVLAGRTTPRIARPENRKNRKRLFHRKMREMRPGALRGARIDVFLRPSAPNSERKFRPKKEQTKNTRETAARATFRFRQIRTAIIDPQLTSHFASHFTSGRALDSKKHLYTGEFPRGLYRPTGY